MKKQVLTFILSLVLAGSMMPSLATIPVYAEASDETMLEATETDSVEGVVNDEAAKQLESGNGEAGSDRDSEEAGGLADSPNKQETNLGDDDTTLDGVEASEEIPEQKMAEELDEPLGLVNADASEVDSGTCGSRVSWTLYSDGILVISGSGYMTTYTMGSGKNSPFKNNQDIKKIIIEEGVQSIGDCAFQGCRNLEEVVLPSTLASIYDYAFSGCRSLKDLSFITKPTYVGPYAFSYCGFENLVIPAGIDSLEEGVFYGCSQLQYVYIPQTVKKITGKETNNSGLVSHTTDPAFKDCDALIAIYCEPEKTGTYWDSNWNSFSGSITTYYSATENDYLFGIQPLDGVKDVIVPEGVTRLYTKFENNDQVETIVLPSTIAEIDPWAFSKCTQLKSIELPDSIANIGYSAFSGCTSLKTINLPSNIEKIDSSTFNGCTSLEGLVIPAGVTSIGSSAFSGCSSLKEIELPEGITKIYSWAFESCTSLTHLELPSSLEEISSCLCRGCSNLEYVFINNCKFSDSIWDDPDIINRTIRKDRLSFTGCHPELKVFTRSTNGGENILLEMSRIASPRFHCVIASSRDYYDFCRTLNGDETRVDIPSNMGTVNIDALYDLTDLDLLVLSGEGNHIYSHDPYSSDINYSVSTKYLYLKDFSGYGWSLPDHLCESLEAFYCDDMEEVFLQDNKGIHVQIKCRSYYGVEDLTDITLLPRSEITDLSYKGVNTKIDCGLIDKNGNPLIQDEDYTVSYSVDPEKKTASIDICGVGNYYGHVLFEPAVTLPRTSDVEVSTIPDQTYTGRRIMPEVVLSLDETVLKEGEDYTISYFDNTAPGVAQIKIEFNDLFDGERVKTIPFSIVENPEVDIHEIGYQLTIICGETTTSARYLEGDAINLTDSNNVVYKTFEYWQVDTGDFTLTPEERILNPLSFSMPASDLTITAIYSGASLKEELEAEESRYESRVFQKSYYQSQANIYAESANKIKNKYGVVYLKTASEYTSLANSTQSTIQTKQTRLNLLQSSSAGGNAAEIARLKREIEELQATYRMYLELKGAAEQQAKAESAQSMSDAIDLELERRIHDTNVTSICDRHGVADSDVSEVETIELSQNEYAYTGNAYRPAVTITTADGAILDNTAYDVVYPTDCYSVGEHNVSIVFKGDYRGAKTKSFNIRKVSGWYKNDNNYYYFDDDGVMVVNNWAQDNTGWRWLDANGRASKAKWISWDGKWYYLNSDGYRAENQWAKDSKGWCYLASDGHMVTNDWVKDSKGWCWIASNGYMPTTTQWIKYNGGWYYIEKGYRVENSWRKDSKGWCYLGPDGRMVTNDWVKDSKGYCWIGSNGYMPTTTQWIQYNGDWYHITDGYRDQSKWMKDSKGWCWLQADGRMLTNGWAKDSIGWCWIASNGYMPTTTQWVKYDGGWYHITKGYRDQNKWMKDSKGWCWLQADGRMLTSGWAKDSIGWCWIAENGYMPVETGWIGEEGVAGSSYIINGYRVDNKTIEIKGVSYTFDANGKLVE